MERAISGKLDLPFRLDQRRHRIAPKDQSALAPTKLGAHPKRLAARTTVDPRQRDDLDVAGLRHPRPQIGHNLLLQLIRHGAGSRRPLNPLGACAPMISCSSTPCPSRLSPFGPVNRAEENAGTCRKWNSFSL